MKAVLMRVQRASVTIVLIEQRCGVDKVVAGIEKAQALGGEKGRLLDKITLPERAHRFAVLPVTAGFQRSVSGMPRLLT